MCIRGQKSHKLPSASTAAQGNHQQTSKTTEWLDDADDWGSDDDGADVDVVTQDCGKMTIDEDDEDDLIVEGDVAEAEIEEPDSSTVPPAVDEGDGATAAEEATVDSCIPELFTCGPGGHSEDGSSVNQIPTAFDPFYIAVDEEYQGNQS